MTTTCWSAALVCAAFGDFAIQMSHIIMIQCGEGKKKYISNCQALLTQRDIASMRTKGRRGGKINEIKARETKSFQMKSFRDFITKPGENKTPR